LRSFIFRNCIHIIASIALIPIDMTGSQGKPLEFRCGPASPALGGDGIGLVDFITFIIVVLAVGQTLTTLTTWC
jgi:hypothetical protein